MVDLHNLAYHVHLDNHLPCLELNPTSTPSLTFFLVLCGLPIRAPLDDFSIWIAFKVISHLGFFDVVAYFQESHHDPRAKNTKIHQDCSCFVVACIWLLPWGRCKLWWFTFVTKWCFFLGSPLIKCMRWLIYP